MSNAELWDLDTSGGIMEQIQMLVAPPVSADALRRSRRRRERDVYRRPGRAINHDCCDSCKEGGDLICCDKCPSAFHLLCHDPPLTEEDLPTGEWLCHKCKISPQETRDDDAESTSSKSSVRSNRSKRVLVQVDPEPDSEHPLRTLAKAARLMNPVQFDVGKEIACNKYLPGSSKRVYGKAAVKNVPKKQAHELDNGIVPLPAKTCFSCNKSCRVAPLIQCDYCPLLFHLDCLNPPLTSVPTGRWMCPNHVEHFLDSHLLKSQSLTERLRLWDRYTGLVNSHTVKVDFLNKVHRTDPMFRVKRKLPKRPSIEVPAAIKEFYKHRPELLPGPVPLPATSAIDLPGSRGSHLATLEEQEEWLSGVVSMQSSIAKYLAQRQLQRSFDPMKSSTDALTSKPTASVAPVIQKETTEESTVTTTSSSNLSTDPVKSILSSSASSASSGSSTSTAHESLDCDNTYKVSKAPCYSLPNGEEKQGIFSGVVLDKFNALSQRPSGSNPLFNSDSISSGSDKWNHHRPVNGLDDSSTNTQEPPLSNGDLNLPPLMPEWHDDRVETGSIRARSNSTESVPSPTSTDFVHFSDAQHLPNGNCDLPNNRNNVINSIGKINSGVNKTMSGNFQSNKVVFSGNKSFVESSSLHSNHQPHRVTHQPFKTVSAPSAHSNTPKVISVAAIGKSTTISHMPSVSQDRSNFLPTSSHNLLPAIQNLNAALQQWITEGGEFELSKFDENLTQLLAWQRLQQLLPPKSSSISTLVSSGNSGNVARSSPVPHISGPSPLQSSSNGGGKKGLLNVYLSQQSTSEVRARAVLCPLTGKGQAFPMPYRTLSLGTGADMDVCLSDYGHCNFTSGHHATIFYDEMTRHFELLNYSEHGTTVDNVLYSCDFSDKPASTPQPSPLVAAVRGIISGKNNLNKKGGNQSNENEKDGDEAENVKLKMSAKGNLVPQQCNCKGSSSSLIGGNGAGWEGTALLHHGSYIKLGCLQFVFSIVDQAPDQVAPISSHHDSNLSHHAPLSTSWSTQPRFSSMPLLSSSQYLHSQALPTSLLKSQVKAEGPP